MQLNHQNNEFFSTTTTTTTNTSRVVLSGLSLNTLNNTNNSHSNKQQHNTKSGMVSTSTTSQHLQHLILQQQLINESVSEQSTGATTQQQQQQAAAAAARYKTELCRSFQENGTCKYGEKCQFAHGFGELRSMTRHPKYKTELCRTFHANGYCPYGPRCHFVHESTSQLKVKQSPIKQKQQETNSLLMCASDSLSREFTSLNLNLNDQFDVFTSFGSGMFGLGSLLNSASSSLSSSSASSRKESTSSSSSSSTEISPRSLSPDHFSGIGGSSSQFGDNFGSMNGFAFEQEDYEPSTQLLVNQILNNINYF